MSFSIPYDIIRNSTYGAFGTNSFPNIMSFVGDGKSNVFIILNNKNYKEIDISKIEFLVDNQKIEKFRVKIIKESIMMTLYKAPKIGAKVMIFY